MTEFDIPPVALAPAAPPAGDEPPGFDEFRSDLLVRSRSKAATRLEPERSDAGGLTIDVVTLPGFGDHPLHGWFVTPAERPGTLPGVVELVPPGGLGTAGDHTWLASAGYVHLVVELRHDGDPRDPYNHEISADAVRAVQEVRSLPGVDPSRVAVLGRAGAGCAAVAAAGLLQDIACVIAEAPFAEAHTAALRAFARRASSPVLLGPGAGAPEIHAAWGAHSAQVVAELSGVTPPDVVERVLDDSAPAARRATYEAWLSTHTTLGQTFVPQVAN
ncbi:acetylxylan esterase [Myceligenerans pegani]|uniref:Acetylxylan esterase n=1 Tax=Myceligenerans pegani TaxID=2776917 RepID=A0ABR9MTE5_9MICO|nr:acetylxylan esterase [Myceligenerans sp. TRM 65318]MBE1874634.1 acetylxylan esterase [Myceligenerans sp. TRM 65318]MBE3016905.1 acetylxylan esterase [Myceligenerans sp. TRM 65318]